MQMKKKVLTAAIFAAMGMGSAHAVNLSQDGTGEVLIFPYYTTQGTEETLMSIVNTTAVSKAVKVRFREAMNSHEVLDFNLYLSPYDVWTAKIFDDPAGAGSAITTNDQSCTIPGFVGATIPFRSSAYQADGGPTAIERTTEGYIEIIEMGVPDLTNILGLGLGGWDEDGVGGVDAIHIAGVPRNCASMQASMSAGQWSANTAVGMLPPTGGLMGSAGIINVALGNEVSVPVTVLDSFSNVQIHNGLATLAPTLSSVSPAESVVYMNDAGIDGMVGLVASQDAEAYWDAWLAPIDAVSAVMMAQTVQNEFSVNPVVSAETDWVITFPTKNQYVNQNLAGGIPPFTSDFPFNEATGLPMIAGSASDGMACEPVNVVVYDREERSQAASLDFSPIIIAGNNLCWEANVINFGDSDVLSASYVDVPIGTNTYTSGWATFAFNAAGHNLIGDFSGNTYFGLPAIGFRTTRLANGDVVGGNYEMSVAHTYNRVVTDTGLGPAWVQ